MAKYLIDDVPILLKSEGLHTVPEVLNIIFKSLPANAGDFIKWVAEVRRQEEDEPRLSMEEKERLAVKEEVLQQVHETELFKYVSDFLLSERSCCANLLSSSDKELLPEIPATVCCQAAVLLSGGLGASKSFCCSETCIKCLRANGHAPMTVVSGTVVSHGNKQAVDMLIPVTPGKLKSCCSFNHNNRVVMHPTINDVLTVLLLALPSQTWMGIKDDRLLAELRGLVSTENLPDVLEQEVLHLLRRLHFLKKCKDKELDKDIMLPSRSS